jgi:hypothetical protein
MKIFKELLRLAFHKGSNRMGVYLRSPENGNRSGFGNTVSYNVQNTGCWIEPRVPVTTSKI